MNIEKVKRAQTYMHNGKQVWVEHPINSLKALVCDNEARELTDNYFEVRISELKPLNKARTGIQSKPKPLTKSQREFKAEISVFLANQTLTMPDRCENCGKLLQAFNLTQRKACIAHILPKKNNEYGFPSVAIHPQNRMYLCAKGGCHNLWDLSDGKKRMTMKIYKKAIERFEQFKHILTQKELIRAYSYLNITWK